MGPKSLRIDQLKLDLANPRIGTAASQHEAIQALIDDQDYKLANLAENILENGLNPLDRFLVILDEEDEFTVLEGNRRAAALKILLNPTVLTGLEVRPALQKRFEALAPRFRRESVEPVAAFEVRDRSEGIIWVEQRHRGEDEGRGIVGWSAEAVARFSGRDPAIQALDFVRKHAELTESENEALAARFPITTLDRLLSTPAVRQLIGVDIEDNKLVTSLPPQEVLKPLRRIAVDLASKKVNVTQLKLVRQQVDYVSALEPEDLPDLATATACLVPIDVIFETASAGHRANSERPSRKASARTLSDRLGIVPRACQLNVRDDEIAKLYLELRRLNPKRFPFATGAVLKLFLERSAENFNRRYSGRRPTYTTISVAVERMVRDGADPTQVRRVHNAHNRQYSSAEMDPEFDLSRAWDDAQAFLEIVWS